MNYCLRKIRAKVGFFRELSEKCAKKAEEIGRFAWFLGWQWLKSLAKNLRFYAINTLCCIKKVCFFAIERVKCNVTNDAKKGSFSLFCASYFPNIFVTLSPKYLSGLGAGASPILLPLRMRIYSGKVRTL